MPKIVDHNERRKLIAKATLGIISKEGIQGASVRSIAKEANLSLGAVRHYFKTQEELLEFALKLVEEQVTDRINELAKQPLPPKEMARKILMELLPIGDRMVEMKVWFEYISYKLRKNELETDNVYDGIATLLYKLNEAGCLKENISLKKEIVYFHALINGLALNMLMGLVHLDEKEIEKLIERELNRVIKEQIPK